MAMSKYTGGGFNYTSSFTPSYTPMVPVNYYVPPTPRPQYNLDSRHSAMSEWNEERRQRDKRTSLIPAVIGSAAVILNQTRRRKKKKGHNDKSWRKRRGLEEGAIEEEEESGLVEEVHVGCGDDVTLPCRAPDPDSVDGLEWTRSDLDQYVYLTIDGRPDLTEQHQDYRGRCELEKGTSTLLLRNVTSADRGVYECRFIKRITKRSIIQERPVSRIRLRVRDSGACAEAEEVDGDVSDGDRGVDGGEYLPVETSRHHYIVAGVVGVYGLVMTMIGLVWFAAL